MNRMVTEFFYVFIIYFIIHINKNIIIVLEQIDKDMTLIFTEDY